MAKSKEEQQATKINVRDKQKCANPNVVKKRNQRKSISQLPSTVIEERETLENMPSITSDSTEQVSPEIKRMARQIHKMKQK